MPEVTSPTGVVWAVGCGSRKWTDCASVARILEGVRHAHPLLTVIEGGGPGADQCVANWAAAARRRGVQWIHRPARWDDYGDHEHWRAAHERNQYMIDMLVAARAEHGHAVAVVAFKAGLDPSLFTPGEAHGGTEDLIRRAWTAGIVDVFHLPSPGHGSARRLDPPLGTPGVQMRLDDPG